MAVEQSTRVNIASENLNSFTRVLDDLEVPGSDALTIRWNRVRIWTHHVQHFTDPWEYHDADREERLGDRA